MELILFELAAHFHLATDGIMGRGSSGAGHERSAAAYLAGPENQARIQGNVESVARK